MQLNRFTPLESSSSLKTSKCHDTILHFNISREYRKQEEQIEDLKALIQDVLVQQIAVEMGKHLRDIIREKVSPARPRYQPASAEVSMKVVPRVRERVAERVSTALDFLHSPRLTICQLQHQFPEGVADQLAAHRVQLNLVKQSLQNA